MGRIGDKIRAETNTLQIVASSFVRMTASSDEDIFSRIYCIFKVKIGTLFPNFNNFVRVGLETLSGVSS
jgi:hypothetical protein